MADAKNAELQKNLSNAEKTKGTDGQYTETRYGQDKDPQDIGELHRQLKAR